MPTQENAEPPEAASVREKTQAGPKIGTVIAPTFFQQALVASPKCPARSTPQEPIKWAWGSADRESSQTPCRHVSYALLHLYIAGKIENHPGFSPHIWVDAAWKCLLSTLWGSKWSANMALLLKQAPPAPCHSQVFLGRPDFRNQANGHC